MSFLVIFVMNPKLFIQKRQIQRNYDFTTNVDFIIVNADYPKDYPANFVCILPRNLDSITKKSIFQAKFGNNSSALAKRLLTKALNRETDPMILAEIQDRLKKLSRDTEFGRRKNRPKTFWRKNTIHGTLPKP